MWRLTDIFGWTSGSPLSVTGSIGASTGDLGDYVVIQVAVASSTSGTQTIPGEAVVFAWDEL